MKHFLVLFFDKASNALLHDVAQMLHESYWPQREFVPVEHHLTIQYFQCEEEHYPKIISEIEKKIPLVFPLKIDLKDVVEYVNELNNFCSLSWVAEKSNKLVKTYNLITKPLDDLHLHHEPAQDWPPHITCFPGASLQNRPKDWTLPEAVALNLPIRNLTARELRLTRWTGSHIDTIHHFFPQAKEAVAKV
jgi:2'-5' RNA ligase